MPAGILCVFFLLGWGVMDLVYCESILGILYIRVSPFVWAEGFYFFVVFMRKRNDLCAEIICILHD